MSVVPEKKYVTVEPWYLDTVTDPLGMLPVYEPRLPWRSLTQQFKEKLRQRFSTARGLRRYYDRLPVDDGVCCALRSHLEACAQRGERLVAVLSPHPQDKTLSPSDGYVRRVSAVDRKVFEGSTRVYLYDSPYWSVCRVRAFYVAPGEYTVIFNGMYAAHRAFVRSLISVCGVCYIQSVLRLLHGHNFMEELLEAEDVRYILDMHGTVPAEFSLNGDEEGARAADEAERACARRCALFVTVNEAAQAYLDKRAEDVAILPFPLYDAPDAHVEKREEETRIIYAGGMQKWQLIDEMLAATRSCENKSLRYAFLVSDPQLLTKKLDGFEAQVLSVPPQEVAAYYEKAHYGFLLRDDNDVNRYACPTKLFEYLAWGIVPILKTPYIGDFLAFGLQWVPLEDFSKGILPSPAQRAEMARENLSVLEKIRRQSLRGEEDLRRYLWPAE